LGFFFKSLAQQSDLNTLEGRAQFAASAISHIKNLPAGLFQGIILDELSKRSRVSLEDLKAQLIGKEKTESANIIPIQPRTQKSKLAAPMKLAIGLLIQYPHLAELIRDPLPPTGLAGHEFLQQLIATLQHNPRVTTGTLIEYWRGKKEESFVLKLAQWEHLIPEAGIEKEFIGTIRQLTLLGMDKTINSLLAKAGQQGLDDEEKQALSEWIAKKKANVITT